MATQANEATGKAGTSTNSRNSKEVSTTPEGTILRANAPEVRTLEQLQRKNEQVLDAIERGVLSPKQIDGMNTTLKQIRALGIDIPLRLMSMIAKYGKGGLGNIPYPRGPMIRQFMGLPAEPAPKEVGKAFLLVSELEKGAK